MMPLCCCGVAFSCNTFPITATNNTIIVTTPRLSPPQVKTKKENLSQLQWDDFEFAPRYEAPLSIFVCYITYVYI
jgi:hypothetical protein